MTTNLATQRILQGILQTENQSKQNYVSVGSIKLKEKKT
jgi:hypothetical protein